MYTTQEGHIPCAALHARELMALTIAGIRNYNKAKSTIVSRGASASGLYVPDPSETNSNTTYASRSTIGRANRRRRNNSARKRRKVVRGFGTY